MDEDVKCSMWDCGEDAAAMVCDAMHRNDIELQAWFPVCEIHALMFDGEPTQWLEAHDEDEVKVLQKVLQEHDAAKQHVEWKKVSR